MVTELPSWVNPEGADDGIVPSQTSAAAATFSGATNTHADKSMTRLKKSEMVFRKVLVRFIRTPSFCSFIHY